MSKRLARALDARLPFDLKRVRDESVAGIREGIGGTVRATRVPAMARRYRAQRSAGILLYHNPLPDVLERHLAYLAEHHPFVPYEAIATAVRSGDWSELPPKCIAVTLDDGHAANVDLIPVFRRFGIVPTIFLCTSIVGTHRSFWWTAEGLAPAERDRLMCVPDGERLAALRDLCAWEPTQELRDSKPQTLSRDQIVALAADVDFQAHTRFHPILPACDDAAAWDEIAGSRTAVEELTGRPCDHFAYPNGRYGPRELELVARAGYASARTVATGWNDPNVHPHQLRVLGIPDGASLGVLAAQTTGFWGLRRLMFLS